MPEESKSEFFIHPQISLAWVQALSRCGSLCVHVGIVMRFRHLLEKSDTISATSKKFESFCVSKHQKLRALKKMERAGLIRIEQQPGSNPKVVAVDPLPPILE